MMHSDNSADKPLLPIWVLGERDIRQSLRFALSSYGLQIGSCIAEDVFFSKIGEIEAGCVLINVLSNDEMILRITERIVAANNSVKIVVLAEKSTVSTVVRVFDMGVAGFFEQPVDPGLLAQRIIKAMNNAASEREIRRLLAVFETFSRREAQIFELICEGMTSGEIAEKLFLSKRTVEVHRTNIGKRLGDKAPVVILYELFKALIPVSPLDGKKRARR